MSEVTAPPPPRTATKPAPPARAPTPPAVAAVRPAPRARGGGFSGTLAAATSALVRITARIFGEVRERAGTSVADFRARPEHSRWRAYALGSYGMILAATFAGQLYTDNSMGAYVRVQKVEVPAMTQIFVRNDSRRTWNNVRLTLNGLYTYEQASVRPGLFMMVPVEHFVLFDSSGRPVFAPRNVAPQQLSIDADEQQHYETELR